MNMISFAVRKSTPSTNLLRIAALLTGLLLVPALALGQAFVQVNSNTAASAATVAVTYTAAEAAGNLNVVVVGWSDTTSSVASVTDDNTNTYKLVGTTAGHGLSQAIYYAPNIAVTPHATPTVTVTFDQAALAPDVRILEYSGLSTTFPLDNWAGITANSATADSGPATTTGTDLILGAGTAGPGTGFNAAGATFTLRLLTPGFGDIVEDSNAGLPAGSHNATGALSPAGTWVMQVAGFSTTPVTFAAPVIDPTTPISRITGPSTGGTQVTIFGTNFQPGAVVFFGTGPTRFSALNCIEDGGNTISCFTPAHAAGLVDVTVVNVDGQSSTATGGYTFVLVVPPTFTSVVPATGPTNGATPITITGTQFQNGATVNINNLPADNVQFVSATSITATTPGLPAATADVTVINPDGGTITAPDAFTYALGSGPINYIQSATTATGSALTTVPVTMSKVQTAGNLNVVIIGWNDTTTTVSSVTDTEGNTYTIAAPLVTGTGLSQIVYFAKNIAGEASNPNEVTVTFSGAAPAPDVRVLEYKGLDIANPLDTTHSGFGTSNLADSGGPCNTATATELVVAGATVASSVSAPGTGFTTVALTHPNGDNAEHQIRTTVGSCQATAVVAGGNWVMQTVAFKAAAAAPDFTINATNFAPPSVAAGVPATSTVTVAPLNGFNSSVALSCTITPVVTPPPTCAFATTPIPGGSGTSVLTLNSSATTPVGGYTVTVSGVGGAVTHPKVLSLTITAAVASDFTIVATPLSPTTVAAGASATSTITITRVNGLADPVALTCSVTPAATRGPTCALNPASLTGATLASTLTVSTTAATTASLEPRSRGLIYAMLFPIGGLALLGTGITSRKKKLWGFLLGCILFSTLIILPACGGSSSGGGGGGGGHPGTPAGIYTVTVTGTSGSLTHPVTPALTVTVQ